MIKGRLRSRAASAARVSFSPMRVIDSISGRDVTLRDVFGPETELIRDVDAVVFACHAPQALRILGDEATADERATLGALRTQRNLAVVKAEVDFIRESFKGSNVEPDIVVHDHCGEAGAIGSGHAFSLTSSPSGND